MIYLGQFAKKAPQWNWEVRQWGTEASVFTSTSPLRATGAQSYGTLREVVWY